MNWKAFWNNMGLYTFTYSQKFNSLPCQFKNKKKSDKKLMGCIHVSSKTSSKQNTLTCMHKIWMQKEWWLVNDNQSLIALNFVTLISAKKLLMTLTVECTRGGIADAIVGCEFWGQDYVRWWLHGTGDMQTKQWRWNGSSKWKSEKLNRASLEFSNVKNTKQMTITSSKIHKK